MRILVVEDAEEIARAIANRLGKIGHAVDIEGDGDTAAELLRVQAYDLVVLDMTLPGVDGSQILRDMRRRRCATPVLVITARSGVDERIDALDLGADDYLVKPFDYRELEARARALLRRAGGRPDNLLQFGGLTIDRGGRIAAIDGVSLDLTRRELTVLEILAARPGRHTSKSELVEQLFSFEQEPSENAVEQFVARLRRKLADTTIEIRTERGLGYRLETR